MPQNCMSINLLVKKFSPVRKRASKYPDTSNCLLKIVLHFPSETPEEGVFRPPWNKIVVVMVSKVSSRLRFLSRILLLPESFPFPFSFSFFSSFSSNFFRLFLVCFFFVFCFFVCSVTFDLCIFLFSFSFVCYFLIFF